MIEELSKILSKEPNNIKVHINRAFEYLKIEDYEKALVDLKKTIELIKNDKNIYKINLYNYALCCILLGKYEQALNYLNKLYNKDKEFFLEISHFCFPDKRMDNEDRDYDFDYPYFDYPDYFNVPIHIMRNNPAKKYIDLLKNFINYYPNKVLPKILFYNINYNYFYNRKIELLKEALDLTNDKRIKEFCYDKLYEYYYRAKEYSVCLKYINKSIEINSADLEKYFQKGKVLYNLDKFNEALSYFNRFIEPIINHEWEGISLSITASKAFSFSLEILFKMNKYEELINNFSKCIKFFEDIIIHQKIASVKWSSFWKNDLILKFDIELTMNYIYIILERKIDFKGEPSSLLVYSDNKPSSLLVYSDNTIMYFSRIVDYIFNNIYNLTEEKLIKEFNLLEKNNKESIKFINLIYQYYLGTGIENIQEKISFESSQKMEKISDLIKIIQNLIEDNNKSIIQFKFKMAFIEFIENYLNQYEDYFQESSSSRIKIFYNIKSVINTAIDLEYNELLLKKEQEKSQVKIQAQKEMMSFLTHTLRNALSTGPETVREILLLIEQTLGEEYKNSLVAYKVINNAASLFATFTFLSQLLDTFKLYGGDSENLTKAWKEDNEGESNLINLFALVIKQTLSRILFSETQVKTLERLTSFQKKSTIKKVRKSFLEIVLNFQADSDNPERIFGWVKDNFPVLSIKICENIPSLNSKGVRFSLLFACFSEILYNALKYSDGKKPIQIEWMEQNNYFIFSCRNTFTKESCNQSGSRKGLIFIHRVTDMIQGIELTFKSENFLYETKILINKNIWYGGKINENFMD